MSIKCCHTWIQTLSLRSLTILQILKSWAPSKYQALGGMFYEQGKRTSDFGTIQNYPCYSKWISKSILSTFILMRVLVWKLGSQVMGSGSHSKWKNQTLTPEVQIWVILCVPLS